MEPFCALFNLELLSQAPTQNATFVRKTLRFFSNL